MSQNDLNTNLSKKARLSRSTSGSVLAVTQARRREKTRAAAAAAEALARQAEADYDQRVAVALALGPSSANILDFIGFFIINSGRIFLVLQREQTDLVELCFKHL